MLRYFSRYLNQKSALCAQIFSHAVHIILRYLECALHHWVQKFASPMASEFKEKKNPDFKHILLRLKRHITQQDNNPSQISRINKTCLKIESFAVKKNEQRLTNQRRSFNGTVNIANKFINKPLLIWYAKRLETVIKAKVLKNIYRTSRKGD